MTDVSPQLAQFAQLRALMSDDDQFQPLIDSFARDVSAKAVSRITESLVELESIGVDPDKYLAIPRSYYRNLREKKRIEAETLMANEELKQKRAATQLAELATLQAYQAAGIPLPTNP